MSIFPTGRAATSQPGSGRLAEHEADGLLVRPIRGQIYLIEEDDPEMRPYDGARSPRSGLVSRH